MNKDATKVRDPLFQKAFDHFVSQCEKKIKFHRLSMSLSFHHQLIVFAIKTDEENTKLDIGSTYLLQGSATQKCLESNEPLTNNILEDTYPENEIYKESNFKSAIHFPIYIEDKSAGSLDIFSFEDSQYSEEEVEFLQSSIYTLSLLLENYNLHSIIKKSENILTRHPLDLEYALHSENEPVDLSRIDDYIKEILTNVYDYIFVENFSGEIIQVSSSLSKLLKYSDEDILGQSVASFCVEEDREKLVKILDEKKEGYIRFNKKDNLIIPLFIKIFKVNDFQRSHSVTIYQASEEPKALSGDILHQMEGQFGVVDLSFHLQYVSPSLHKEFDEPLLGRKCYLAYNNSSEICRNCPIENDLITEESLKKHVVFTVFKDGQKRMILFSLLKLEDGSTVLLEFFKETSLQTFFESEKVDEIEEEDEEPPSEISKFVDYSMNKIQSPVSTLLNYIITLQNTPFNDLTEEIFLEKMKFMYDTARHLEHVLLSMVERLKERIRVQQILLEKALEGALEGREEKTSPYPFVQGKKILLIEPDDRFRNNLFDFLGNLGYKMLQAKDGLEGILKTKKNKPDMILLEVNIPKVNGLLFVEKIKQHIKRKIPCIIISDFNNPEIIDKAHKIGVEKYIKKSPLDIQDLSNTIYNVFNKYSKKPLNETIQIKAKPTNGKSKQIPPPKEYIQTDSIAEAQVDQGKQPEEQDYESHIKSEEKIKPVTDKDNVMNDVMNDVINDPVEEEILLENYGFDIEEVENGQIFDLGMTQGVSYNIHFDEDIIVLKLNGFLEENSLKKVSEELIETLKNPSVDSRKILFNLFEVLGESVTDKMLDLLFSFHQEFFDIPPEYVTILTADTKIISLLKNHFLGKVYSIHTEMLDAFSQLQMEN